MSGETMKKTLLVVLCLLAAGCSSSYLITTRDGETIVSQSKPMLDRDTQMLRFEDRDGRIRQLPQTEIKQIVEQ